MDKEIKSALLLAVIVLPIIAFVESLTPVFIVIGIIVQILGGIICIIMIISMFFTIRKDLGFARFIIYPVHVILSIVYGVVSFKLLISIKLVIDENADYLSQIFEKALFIGNIFFVSCIFLIITYIYIWISNLYSEE